jgi:hypothetical protein
MGTRKRLLDNELLKRAIAINTQESSVISVKDWISVTKNDFFNTKFKPKELGSKIPNEETSKKFECPITFWSDFATKETGRRFS